MPLSSKQPKFYDIILPHWKNFTRNQMLRKSFINTILTCLDILYQWNLLLGTLDFTPSGVNSL